MTTSSTVVDGMISLSLECEQISSKITALYLELSKKRSEMAALSQELDSFLLMVVEKEDNEAGKLSTEILEWDDFLLGLELSK